MFRFLLLALLLLMGEGESLSPEGAKCSIARDRRHPILNPSVIRATPPTWSYHDPPKNWKDVFPLCGGSRQSPIDLTAAKKVFKRRSPRLKFNVGRDADLLVEAENTGFTIDVFLSAFCDSAPLLFLNGNHDTLSGKYRFESLHFHWGDAFGNPGSEHAIDSWLYPAEVHLVFSNVKYGDIDEALERPDGLAVIGILLKPAKPGETPDFPSLGLESALPQLSAAGEEVIYTLPSQSGIQPLMRALEQALEKFYSYPGSLTTPPCNPVVSWVVAAEPMTISHILLHLLQTQIYKDPAKTELLVNNRRPLQDREGRTIKLVTERKLNRPHGSRPNPHYRPYPPSFAPWNHHQQYYYPGGYCHSPPFYPYYYPGGYHQYSPHQSYPGDSYHSAYHKPLGGYHEGDHYNSHESNHHDPHKGDHSPNEGGHPTYPYNPFVPFYSGSHYRPSGFTPFGYPRGESGSAPFVPEGDSFYEDYYKQFGNDRETRDQFDQGSGVENEDSKDILNEEAEDGLNSGAEDGFDSDEVIHEVVSFKSLEPVEEISRDQHFADRTNMPLPSSRVASGPSIQSYDPFLHQSLHNEDHTSRVTADGDVL